MFGYHKQPSIRLTALPCIGLPVEVNGHTALNRLGLWEGRRLYRAYDWLWHKITEQLPSAISLGHRYHTTPRGPHWLTREDAQAIELRVVHILDLMRSGYFGLPDGSPIALAEIALRLETEQHNLRRIAEVTDTDGDWVEYAPAGLRPIDRSVGGLGLAEREAWEDLASKTRHGSFQYMPATAGPWLNSVQAARMTETAVQGSMLAGEIPPELGQINAASQFVWVRVAGEMRTTGYPILYAIGGLPDVLLISAIRAFAVDLAQQVFAESPNTILDWAQLWTRHPVAIRRRMPELVLNTLRKSQYLRAAVPQLVDIHNAVVQCKQQWGTINSAGTFELGPLDIPTRTAYMGSQHRWIELDPEGEEAVS